MRQISPAEIEALYFNSLENNILAIEDKAVIFYAKAMLLDRLAILQRHFPSRTLHSVAIKANSSLEVLQLIVAEGFGLEAASLEEVKLAIAAGIAPQKIVFDSPVKTREEIAYCHHKLPGMFVNANSLVELERYPTDFSGKLGLRINPLVHTDAPDFFDVVRKNSKFGVPISQENEILEACLKYTYISGLHLHVGSGIKDFSGNVAGIEKVLNLAHLINEKRKLAKIATKIDWIDIGGGIHFDAEQGEFSVQAFVQVLETETDLFQSFDVITEYGAFVHKHNSFAISRIEYILESNFSGIAHTAFIHVGADLFLRKVYSNLPIEYPCFIIKNKNVLSPMDSGFERYNIAGPLCFAGDYLYYDLELPTLEEGDIFVIQDIGANTLSMWSRHCSREEPKVVVY